MKYLKYTLKQLQRYCNDPNSCLKCVTDEISIGIKPAGLACFREAVTEALVREKVGRYDAKLKGIVVDVRNIKVLGNDFSIHNDNSTMFIHLRADLYVFEPRLDAVVKGIIKHIAPGHISVNIHKVFNVAVGLSGPKRDLGVNNEVSIKITKFDLKYQIPNIEAVLDSPRRIIVFEDSDKNGLAQDSGISTEGSSKDVGKAKKRARSISSSDTDSDSDLAESKTVSLLDHKTVIKQEPRSNNNSSSESEAEEPSKRDGRKQEDSSGSDSEDYNKTIVTVKKEKNSSDSSIDESVKKQRSNDYDSDDDRSNAARGNSDLELSVFSKSEDSDASITPYQKPNSKATTLSPKITIKTEEIMPEKSPLKRRRLQSPPPPPPERPASPVSPAPSTPSFASKRKRRNSIAPQIDEIISKHIRIKTEALPLPTPPPSPAKAKKTPSTPATSLTKKTPVKKVNGAPKITIKSEKLIPDSPEKPPLKQRRLQSPPPEKLPSVLPPERSTSPVRSASPTPFAAKRKRRSSIAPKIDEIISKQLLIKTEATALPLSSPKPQTAPVPSKAKAKKSLPLQTVTPTQTPGKTTSTAKVKKTNVKIEPGTSEDSMPSLFQAKSPDSVTEKMAQRYESSKKKRTNMDALVYKVLAEKAAIPDDDVRSDCAQEADTARKALKLSANLPHKTMKHKKAKRDVESLLMKVMAHKICEVLSSTQNDSTIANASQFGSPALSSTRNESKPAKKLKSKKTELLNKMLSKS